MNLKLTYAAGVKRLEVLYECASQIETDTELHHHDHCGCWQCVQVLFISNAMRDRAFLISAPAPSSRPLSCLLSPGNLSFSLLLLLSLSPASLLRFSARIARQVGLEPGSQSRSVPSLLLCL